MRLENITRWGSGILMLETIRKANDLGILNENSDNLKSPVAISMIDDYLKILKPAYLFNLN